MNILATMVPPARGLPRIQVRCSVESHVYQRLEYVISNIASHFASDSHEDCSRSPMGFAPVSDASKFKFAVPFLPSHNDAD